MDRPKIVVNVRFEDRNPSTERVVDEQFEFELVGSHIKVRPLSFSEPEDEDSLQAKGSSPETRKYRSTSPTSVGKKDGIRSERFDHAREAKLDREKSGHDNRKGSPSRKKDCKKTENQNKKIAFFSTSNSKNKCRQGSRDNDDSPNNSPTKHHSSRHISRLEEFENQRRKLQNEKFAEVSNWSIMLESELELPSNKVRNEKSPECGKIHYCVHKDDFPDSKKETAGVSMWSVEPTEISKKKSDESYVVSGHCDINCVAEEFQNRQDGREEQTNRRRDKERKHGGRREKSRQRTDFDNSVEEMKEESLIQFSYHGTTSNRTQYDPEKCCRNHQNRRSKEPSPRSHTSRDKSRKQRQGLEDESLSDESIEMEVRQNYNNENIKKMKHKHSREDPVKQKVHSHANFEISSGRRKNSSDSVEDLLNRLADRLYERRLQMKVILAFKRILEQKRKRESEHHHSKQRKRHPDSTLKEEDLPQEKDKYKPIETTSPSKVICSVRCCSKRQRLDDFYKAHLSLDKEEPQPAVEPDKTDEKQKKEKSASSLYDLGLRTNEDRRS